MSAYVLTKPAAQDIDDILDYISSQSPQTALLVARRFERTFEKIADLPAIGHTRKELRDDSLRVVTCSGYLIIFDSVRQPLHILRVIRGRQNLRRAIRKT